MKPAQNAVVGVGFGPSPTPRPPTERAPEARAAEPPENQSGRWKQQFKIASEPTRDSAPLIGTRQTRTRRRIGAAHRVSSCRITESHKPDERANAEPRTQHVLERRRKQPERNVAETTKNVDCSECLRLPGCMHHLRKTHHVTGGRRNTLRPTSDSNMRDKVPTIASASRSSPAGGTHDPRDRQLLDSRRGRTLQVICRDHASDGLWRAEYPSQSPEKKTTHYTVRVLKKNDTLHVRSQANAIK